MKIDSCPNLPPIMATDEKSLVTIFGVDAKIVGCLRGEVTQWILWDKNRINQTGGK